MIFENGEAIVNLNEDVEKVKADQTVSIYDYATLVITFKRFLIKYCQKIRTICHFIYCKTQRLEHELDFIKGLQTELEDVLKPLEASVAPSSSTATQR